MNPSRSIQTGEEAKTTTALRSRLEGGRGCWLLGARGSGKSYAVRNAVNGAVWINLREDSLLMPRLIADLALQVEPQAGRGLLQRFATSGLTDGLLHDVDQVLGPRWLVLDGAERLRRTSAWAADAPDEAAQEAETSALVNWLERRVRSTPTVVVGRKLPRWVERESLLRHSGPEPTEPRDGAQDWLQVAELMRARPGGRVLARAALLLLGERDFGALLQELRDDLQEDPELSPDGMMRELSDAIRGRLSRPLQQALQLIAALGQAPRALLSRVLAGDSALKVLQDLWLLQDLRGEQVQLLPLAHDLLAETPIEVYRGVFHEAAKDLLASVNDHRSLTPIDADRVLAAHGLYLKIEDFENAARTARLHVGGLIALARKTSQRDDFHGARVQYGRVLELLDVPGEPLTGWSRYRSYAIHYHAYNAQRAGEMLDAQVLADYERARALWPENALWQMREIGMLIRLGRLREAEARLQAGYAEVPEHPRRHAFLRIGPARVATEVEGAALFGLRLIEPVLDTISSEIDPQGAEDLAGVLRRWERGIALSELSSRRGRLVLQSPLAVTMARLGPGFRARLKELEVAAQAATPTQALTELATKVAGEAERMIRQPSHLLSQAEVLWKGRLIGAIDLIASDLGLEFATERWFLGRLEPGRFVPVQSEYAPIEYSGSMRDDAGRDLTQGLYFARARVARDGHPSGPVLHLRPAGSGQHLGELLAALRALQDEGDDDGDDERQAE